MIEAKPGLAQILFPMSLAESSEYLKREYGLTDSVEKITEDTIEILKDFYLYEAIPKKGIIEFLEKMKGLNIPMGIATSGDRRILDTVLVRIGLTVCYITGTVWFMVVYAQNTGPVGLWMALLWCVVPFIVPDLAKLGLALWLSQRLEKITRSL